MAGRLHRTWLEPEAGLWRGLRSHLIHHLGFSLVLVLCDLRTLVEANMYKRAHVRMGQSILCRHIGERIKSFYLLSPQTVYKLNFNHNIIWLCRLVSELGKPVSRYPGG